MSPAVSVILGYVGGIVTCLTFVGYFYGWGKSLYKKVKHPFVLVDCKLVRQTHEGLNKPPWPSGSVVFRFHLKYQGEQNLEVGNLELEWNTGKGLSESVGGFLMKAESLWHLPMELTKGDVISAVVPFPSPLIFQHQPADCDHFGISFKTNKSSERTFVQLPKAVRDPFNSQEFRKFFKNIPA